MMKWKYNLNYEKFFDRESGKYQNF